MAGMTVTFLGTAAAYPSPKRAASSLILTYGEESWMFDCGEGTQIQVMKSDVKAIKISKIFITHLHGDHLFGLPGLLCTLSMSNQRLQPISIYGPEGIGKFIRVTLGLSGSVLNYMYEVFELIPTQDMYMPEDGHAWQGSSNELLLHPNEAPGGRIECDGNGVWHVCEKNNLLVKAGKLNHRVPSFGFVIEENDLPGKLDIKKAMELGLHPGPDCQRLKDGLPVVLPSGVTIQPHQVCGPPRRGRKLVVCGDSSNSSSIAHIARGADLFIHEATLENSMKDDALMKGHSTPCMAAEFALKANCKHLWLTHFSHRYETSSKKPQEENKVEKLLKEAQQVFGSNVFIAEDLLSVSIPLQST